MMYVNNREVMVWQKMLMREGILSFKSTNPFEKDIRYTIAHCALHKDPKNPWFVMVKATKNGKKIIKSKTFSIEGFPELARQFNKLKRMGYITCPLKG